MTRNLILITAAFASMVHLSSADARPVKERVDAPADGTVEIASVSGTIRVEGWRRDAVEVEGEIDDGVERVAVTSDGARTVVKVELPRGRGNHDQDFGADLVIRVPRGSAVIVNTVSAAIDFAGVDGAVRARSASGAIGVDGDFNDADVESVSGTVTIRSSGDGSTVRASSVSGRVDIIGMAGSLEANSVSGQVRVTTDGVSRARLSSMSGTVVYDAALVRGGHYEFETMSGTVDLVVHGRPNAAFELQTFSGSIESELGPAPERTSRFAPGMTLNFTEGRGDATVQAHAMAGRLRIRTR